MAIMGGKVGIGTVDPDEVLHVYGNIKLTGSILYGAKGGGGNGGQPCGPGNEGGVTYSPIAKDLQVCDGKTWKTVGVSAIGDNIRQKASGFKGSSSMSDIAGLGGLPSVDRNVVSRIASGIKGGNVTAKIDPETGEYTYEGAESWQTDDQGIFYSGGEVRVGTEEEPENMVVYGEFECFENFEAYENAFFHGRVGIGTTSPTFDLDVAGDGRFTGDLHIDGEQVINQSLNIEGAGENEFALEIEGAAFATEGWYEPSDIRLKQNIETIEGALDRMLALHGVTFEWNEFSGHNMGDRQMGMIAQDVEKIVPEWVNTDRDGYKSLSYKGFEGLTVEAFRELKQENEELRAELDEIKAMLKGNGLRENSGISLSDANDAEYGMGCGVAPGASSTPFALFMLAAIMLTFALGRKAKK